jgi:hypothetical protein
MNRPRLDDLTRGHLLLAFGVVAGAVALTLVVAPDLVPAALRDLQPAVDEDSVFSVAVLLAIVLLLVAVFRVLSRSSTPLDRSPIRENDPELPASTDRPTVGEHAATAYDRLLTGFDAADRRRRLVAMYGLRAGHVERLPSQIESLLEELAATAADAHATAAGRDESAAREAVRAGTWTDDRVAAAFLAADPEAEPTFTTRERLLAWIAPRRTVEARVERVLDEIERQAGAFLTYDVRSDDGPRTDGDQREAIRGGEVGDR